MTNEMLEDYLRGVRGDRESESTERGDINRRVDEIVKKKEEIEKDKDLKILSIFVSQDLTCVICINNRKIWQTISREECQPLIKKHKEIRYNPTTAEEQIEGLCGEFYEETERKMEF